MCKEFKQHSHQSSPPDYSKMYMKEIFLKGVFVCAMEAVFYVNVVKNYHANEIMTVVKIKPFDFWRLLNSFMKFDPQMPRILIGHFREIELKIVTESAWLTGSPVVEIIKNIIKSQEGNSGVSLTEYDSTLQPYNMFFKRLL